MTNPSGGGEMSRPAEQEGEAVGQRRVLHARGCAAGSKRLASAGSAPATARTGQSRTLAGATRTVGRIHNTSSAAVAAHFGSPDGASTLMTRYSAPRTTSAPSPIATRTSPDRTAGRCTCAATARAAAPCRRSRRSQQRSVTSISSGAPPSACEMSARSHA